MGVVSGIAIAMASRTRCLPAGLALVFVAAIEGSLSMQSTGTRDDLDRLIREARFAAAESAARAKLGELERTVGADSLDVARVLDTLVEALWRGGKYASRDQSAGRAFDRDQGSSARTRIMGTWPSASPRSASSIA